VLLIYWWQAHALLKHVEIHEVLGGKKWMGSLDLDELNRTTSQTAGRSLKKTKQDDNKQVAKQNK